MNRVIDYVIEGVLQDGDKLDFVKDKLAVHAFVSDKEMAQAAVDTTGHYRLTFKYEDTPPSTQLRVTPARFVRATQTLAISESFAPSRYVVKGNTATAQRNLRVPSDYVEIMRPLESSYRVHGEVYAATYEGDEIQYIEVLPSVKIDFYLAVSVPKPPILRRPIHLGYAYSSPTGSYEFNFKLQENKLPNIKPYEIYRTKPVLFATISQMVSGEWKKIFHETIDWGLETDVHKDFFVPKQELIPVPDPGTKPAVGFLFTSLGLLPIDTTRIVNGYAFSAAHDPISVSCQPFCGVLRTFGLFAEIPSVKAYKVQVTTVNEVTMALGSWEDVTDPLYNSVWDPATLTWPCKYLGPNPPELDPGVFPANVYRNVDNDPHIWNEMALKFTWNSAQKTDGLYALQILGYDAAGTVVATCQMPFLRVANTVPEAGLAATIPAPTQCGVIKLTDATITFNVKAYDPDGHVLWYEVDGTRGKDGVTAGTSVVGSRPDPGTTWDGTSDTGDSEVFTVAPITDPLLVACPALAYGFVLTVQGSGTNGYASELLSQRVWQNVNLVVVK